MIIAPSPMQGVLFVSIGWEGAKSVRLGGRGQGGNGKGKGAIVSQTWRHQGGLAHLPIGNTRPLCTAGPLLILCLTTKVPTSRRDNCPFTFPQGGLAHLPLILFVYIWMYPPRGGSKLTPKVHISMNEKVSFNELPMKSKTMPGFLHIYTFKSLALISFNYLLWDIY